MTNEEKITSVLEHLDVLEERRSRISDRANHLAWVFELSSAFNERPAAQSAKPSGYKGFKKIGKGWYQAADGQKYHGRKAVLAAGGVAL